MTGGRIKSKEDWETFQALEPKLTALEQQLSALTAEKEQITPLAKKVNEFVAAGKPVESIMEFLRIQQLDVQAMSPVEAIKAEYQQKYPALSGEQIEAYLIEQNLISTEDVTPPAMVARQMVAAGSAKEYLASLKVASENSTPGAVVQQQQIARQANIEQWRAVQPPAMLVESVVEGDYSAQYQLSPEAVAHGYQSAMAWAAAEGLDVNPSSKQTFEKIVSHFAMAHDAKAMLAFVAKDAYAKGVLAARQSVTAPPPPPVVPGAAPEANRPAKKMKFSD